MKLTNLLEVKYTADDHEIFHDDVFGRKPEPVAVAPTPPPPPPEPPTEIITTTNMGRLPRQVPEPTATIINAMAASLRQLTDTDPASIPCWFYFSDGRIGNNSQETVLRLVNADGYRLMYNWTEAASQVFQGLTGFLGALDCFFEPNLNVTQLVATYQQNVIVFRWFAQENSDLLPLPAGQNESVDFKQYLML